MCRFWITRFPCGCVTSRNSGYEFCSDRNKASCKLLLITFVWTTFCPKSRKALKGKTYNADVRLPPCCDKLDEEVIEKLCLKCDSAKSAGGDGPIRWSCAGCVVETAKEVSPQAPEVFETAVSLWPPDFKGRYYRRKGDDKVKDCGWSV
ncbi:hypothetical protein F5Y16DRAFT_375595 [Xylariaceae sp. FL0255]|nr:hypothetical protein F5Y16DRAFT_375595 [Xylariaceae sp. FL0255]